jgi:hypothetical protein
MPEQKPKKPTKKPVNTNTRRWRRAAAKALKRCAGRCEWVRTDVNLRCARPAASVDMTDPDGDVSPSNMLALCEYHQLMAERSREVARFVAIRVRPPREGD